MTIGVDLSKMHTIGDLQAVSKRPSACSATTGAGRNRPEVDEGPGLVSILRQGDNLIESITPPSMTPRCAISANLIEQIGQDRAPWRDHHVAALDVLDSFGARTLRTLAEMARLRGAETVIVGIEPDVAFSMSHLVWVPAPYTPHSTSKKAWPTSAERIACLRRTAPNDTPPVNALERLRRNYPGGLLPVSPEAG